MRTSFAAAFGFVFCLALTSCMTESAQPISSPTTAVADPRFIGDWRGSEGDEKTYRFLPTKTAWMHVIVIPSPNESSSKANLEVGKFCDAFPSVIGKNTFLNILLYDDDGQRSKNYLLLRYKFSHGNRRIRMWTMEQDYLIDAIAKGKLKGKIEQETFNKNVLLQDTSANILKYIQTANIGDLFDEELEPLRQATPAKK